MGETIINGCPSVHFQLCHHVLKTLNFQSFGGFGIVDKGMGLEGTLKVPGKTSEPSSALGGSVGTPSQGACSFANGSVGQ